MSSETKSTIETKEETTETKTGETLTPETMRDYIRNGPLFCKLGSPTRTVSDVLSAMTDLLTPNDNTSLKDLISPETDRVFTRFSLELNPTFGSKIHGITKTIKHVKTLVDEGFEFNKKDPELITFTTRMRTVTLDVANAALDEIKNSIPTTTTPTVPPTPVPSPSNVA